MKEHFANSDVPSHDGALGPIDPNQDLIDEQNRLAAVDATILQSADVLEAGRIEIGRFAQRRDEPPSGNALNLLQAGRAHVMTRAQAPLTSGVSLPPPSISSDALKRLANELHRQLVELAEEIPEDRIAARTLETRVQAVLRGYSNAVHRIISPISFQR
jgi:hypothetical protein